MKSKDCKKKVGKIGIFGNTYQPQIDGVANVMWNYSRYLEKNHEGAIVFAPKVKHLVQTPSPSPVVRFASIDTVDWIGYSFALPMAPSILKTIRKTPISLMHAHDPLTAFITRELKYIYDIPSIMTYHTKYDGDIREFLQFKPFADFWINMIPENAYAVDEVWVVSRGAAENLRSIGYEGETVLMPNGVDVPREKASEESITKYCSDLPPKVPVFLFVGRLIEGKGIFQIISAMQILMAKEIDYRMVFIGDGRALEELIERAKKSGVYEKCMFLGSTLDREKLRAWYTRADLFLFPSEYDTSGLVVREAAAAGTASLLIEGSSAAEGVLDDVNGFLTKKIPEDIAGKIMQLLGNPGIMKKVGQKASEDLYLSWEDAVELAYERYQIVLDKYKCGEYRKQKKIPGDRIMKAQAAYMSFMAKNFP